jgi:hypothetical protein
MAQTTRFGARKCFWGLRDENFLQGVLFPLNYFAAQPPKHAHPDSMHALDLCRAYVTRKGGTTQATYYGPA